MMGEEACRISGMMGDPCVRPMDGLLCFAIITPLYWICWALHFAGMISVFPTQQVCKVGIFNLHFVEVETEAQRDQSHLPGNLQVNQVYPALSTQRPHRASAAEEVPATPGSSVSVRYAGCCLCMRFQEGWRGWGPIGATVFKPPNRLLEFKCLSSPFFSGAIFLWCLRDS